MTRKLNIPFLLLILSFWGCMVGDNNVDPLGIVSRIQEPEARQLGALELSSTGAYSAVANGVEVLELLVVSKDQKGQALSDVSVSLVVPTDGGQVGAVNLTTDDEGQARWNLTTSTVKGQYQYRVQSESSPQIQSNTLSLQFTAGPVHEITLSANKIVLQTGGGESAEIEAIAEDEHGNLINDLELSLSLPVDGGNLAANPVVTDQNGEATWVVSSSLVPNYYEYSVTKDTVTSNAVGVLFKSTTTPFITHWKTDDTGITDDNQIKLPLISTASYKAIVDWGDGSKSIITSHDDPDRIHTYENPGNYEVKIEGIFERFYSNNGLNEGGDVLKIFEVSQWGDISWTSMNQMFFGANRLRVTATDAPDLSEVTDMSDMFRNVKQLSTEDFSHWDTSNVQIMNRTFMNSTFIGDISSWDTSSVLAMSGMFSSATFFNNDISGWNVSNVTNMSAMFRSTRFNQNLNSWDVSQVLNFSLMFDATLSFNNPLDEWETDGATNVRNMFSNTGAFNQDISNWTLPSVGDSLNFDTNAAAWDCAKRPASVKTCVD